MNRECQSTPGTLPYPEKPIPESYWVVPGKLLAGEYPGNLFPRETIRRLQCFLTQGFEVFVDLTRPDELVPYEKVLFQEALEYKRTVSHVRFPIPDASLPTREEMKAILDCIDSALANNRKVYVHCRAGIGRTGTVVGCYLVRHGLASDQALRRLQELYREASQSQWYPFCPETAAQRAFVLAWRAGW